MAKLNMDHGKATIFIRDMPRGVKDQFKAYCARRGLSIKAMILRLMRTCIENDNLARLDTPEQKKLLKRLQQEHKDER